VDGLPAVGRARLDGPRSVSTDRCSMSVAVCCANGQAESWPEACGLRRQRVVGSRDFLESLILTGAMGINTEIRVELADGRDIQVLTRLDWPVVVTGDHYDEDAIARAFQMASQSIHLAAQMFGFGG